MMRRVVLSRHLWRPRCHGGVSQSIWSDSSDQIPERGVWLCFWTPRSSKAGPYHAKDSLQHTLALARRHRSRLALLLRSMLALGLDRRSALCFHAPWWLRRYRVQRRFESISGVLVQLIVLSLDLQVRSTFVQVLLQSCRMPCMSPVAMLADPEFGFVIWIAYLIEIVSENEVLAPC